MAKAKIVLISFEEDSYQMLTKTNIPAEEMGGIECKEEYEADNLDIEMKFSRYAEENGYFFERIEFNEVSI